MNEAHPQTTADGDGTGDIAGLRSRLRHLAALGVDVGDQLPADASVLLAPSR